MTKEPLFPAMESSVAELQTKHKRLKTFRLEDRTIIDQANAILHRKPGSQIRGLPEDVEVTGVYHDAMWRGFFFIACSMTWPIVRGSEKLEEVEIELVQAPGEETQYVLWKELTDRLDAKQKSIPAPKALEAVTEGVDEADPDGD